MDEIEIQTRSHKIILQPHHCLSELKIPFY